MYRVVHTCESHIEGETSQRRVPCLAHYFELPDGFVLASLFDLKDEEKKKEDERNREEVVKMTGKGEERGGDNKRRRKGIVA